ncbi:putative cell survival pathways protein [Tieghemiomyces parasiticus]|uniref:Cell survival pathways protein n=1 Tax=Tieghemiomyces parasiticus TaxID=78921 RepID=A0A9W8A971_9FUNG|nr:putative cell survival pathways protein [Tieghemiomyces parasiticus]
MSQTPFTAVTADDLKWTASGTGSETQTFYFNTDGGVAGFFQLAWANVGIITTVEVNAAFSNGTTPIFQTFNGGKITLSKDRLSASCKGLTIKNSLSSNPTGSPQVATVEVVLDGGSDLQGHLSFQLTNEGYKVGDAGCFYMGNQSPLDGPAAGQTNNYIKHVYLPAAAVQGSIKIKGGQSFDMTGRGMFIHAHSDMKPYTVSQRWNFAYFVGEDVGLNMLQFITTDKHGKVRVNKGALTLGDRVAAVTHESHVDASQFERDPETGYEIAQHVEYIWEGRTLDGDKPFTAQIKVRPTRLIVKLNILRQVPYLLRKIIEALITKPYIYEWFDEATATITIDGQTREVAGRMFHEVTLLD